MCGCMQHSQLGKCYTPACARCTSVTQSSPPCRADAVQSSTATSDCHISKGYLWQPQCSDAVTHNRDPDTHALGYPFMRFALQRMLQILLLTCANPSAGVPRGTMETLTDTPQLPQGPPQGAMANELRERLLH
jgi:hypothetical protein